MDRNYRKMREEDSLLEATRVHVWFAIVHLSLDKSIGMFLWNKSNLSV